MTTDPDGLGRTDRLLDELGARAQDGARGRDDLTAALASWVRHVDLGLPAVRRRGRSVLGRSLAGGALALVTLTGSSVAAAMTESDLGPLTEVGRVVVTWIPDSIEPVLEAESDEPPRATSGDVGAGDPPDPGQPDDLEGSGSTAARGRGVDADPGSTRSGASQPVTGSTPPVRPGTTGGAVTHEQAQGAGAVAGAGAAGSAGTSDAVRSTPGSPPPPLPTAAPDRAPEVTTPDLPVPPPPVAQPSASGPPASGHAAPAPGTPSPEGHGDDTSGAGAPGGPPPEAGDQASSAGHEPARGSRGGGPRQP